MGRIFHPLLFLLARCTKNQLIRQIEFLKAENQILRSRVPGRFVRVKPAEKARLIKLAEGIGPALQQLITVVRYDTYLCWLRDARKDRVPKKRGRPRTAEVLREIVVKIGTETGWGYTRVMGEMKKLGIKPPSRSTVAAPDSPCDNCGEPGQQASRAAASVDRSPRLESRRPTGRPPQPCPK